MRESWSATERIFLSLFAGILVADACGFEYGTEESLGMNLGGDCEENNSGIAL